jgi:hypothetical protein
LLDLSEGDFAGRDGVCPGNLDEVLERVTVAVNGDPNAYEERVGEVTVVYGTDALPSGIERGYQGWYARPGPGTPTTVRLNVGP